MIDGRIPYVILVIPKFNGWVLFRTTTKTNSCTFHRSRVWERPYICSFASNKQAQT